MRKLIVTNIVSLDGFYEGPGGNVMALPMDAFFDANNAERLRTADTLLLGRRTYDGFKGFWPTVVDDNELVSALREDPREQEVLREISRSNNAIEKVVVSDTLTANETAPWTKTTTIVGRSDAHQRVADLKAGSGGDIVVIGSHILWNDLLAAGLVDELHLMVGATVLGDGTPAFGGASVPSLRLIDTESRDGSSNVIVRYDAQPA